MINHTRCVKCGMSIFMTGLYFQIDYDTPEGNLHAAVCAHDLWDVLDELATCHKSFHGRVKLLSIQLIARDMLSEDITNKLIELFMKNKLKEVILT